MQIVNAFLARVLPGVVVFASTPILFRAYGAVAYGDFARVWSGTLIASSLMTAWLTQGVLREAGLPRARRGLIPGGLFLLQVAGAGLCSVAIALAGVRDQNIGIYLASFALGSANACYSVVASTIQRDERIGILAIAEIAKASTGVIIPLSLLQVTQSAWAMVGGAGVAALVASAICWRRKEITWSAPAGEASGHWSYGWPMALWRGLSTTLLYVDRFVVAWLFSPTLAGAYSAVSDLVIRGFGMIAFPLVMVAHPRIMRISNEGASSTRVSREIRRWLLISIGLLGAAATVFLILQRHLLDWFIGRNLTVPFLSVACLTMLACIWQIALLAHKGLEVRSRTKTMLVLMFISCIVSVILSSMLAIGIGLVGAPLGAVIGAMLYLLMVARVTDKGGSK